MRFIKHYFLAEFMGYRDRTTNVLLRVSAGFLIAGLFVPGGVPTWVCLGGCYLIGGLAMHRSWKIRVGFSSQEKGEHHAPTES